MTLSHPETSLRRLTSVGVLLVAVALIFGAAPGAAESNAGPTSPGPANAGPTLSDGPGFITVIEVNGLIDAPLAAFIHRSIGEAEETDARYLVIHLDSSGVVVSDDELIDLARRIRDADVPVAVWIGPSGAEALGGAAQLAAMADPVGVSIGARIGRTGEPILPPEEFGPLFGDATELLVEGTFGHERVLDFGVAPEEALTLGLFALSLPGFESVEVVRDGERTREPLTVVRFTQLDLVAQLFHTVASPAVTYLLLVIGLALIVFELYTAGIGVAGLVGAGSLVLSSYGLWALPTRPVALVLMLIAFVAFAIDVQTGIPRLWTGIGGVLFVISSLVFFDGMAISWITLVVSFVGITLTFLAGMPAMVRTRFSTPTIGREWMIGERGEARGEISPEGVVTVLGAPWRARTNRATPIADGDAVRVVALEGLLLEVEPEEGAAQDSRA